jgi:hypothetical protein
MAQLNLHMTSTLWSLKITCSSFGCEKSGDLTDGQHFPGCEMGT